MLRRFIAGLGAAMAIGWGAQAAPLEAYGKLPQIEQAEISPSGNLVAYILTDGEKRSVAVEKVAERQPVFLGPVGAAKLRGLTWAGDEHLILTTSTTQQPSDVIGLRVEWLLAFDVDLTTRRYTRLMEKVRGAGETMNTVKFERSTAGRYCSWRECTS